MPHHPLALAVLALTGPLAVTSANRSGEPTPATCAGLTEVFGQAVDVYLCADEPLVGRPSTVVDLTSGTHRVLRAGAIPDDQVADALRDVG
jgi:tRNA A37 threonylcarbamoyladenosine synthetase subunit TsaC/SUA5/YrdC